MKPWINTCSGKKILLLSPDPQDIDIRDIAYVLAGEWRFGGHSTPKLSVAEHSVIVSRVVPWGYAMWGLLHDASEAYLRDIPSPFKVMLKDYYPIEEMFMWAIATRFNLPWPMPDIIHEVDGRCKLTESRLYFQPEADFSDLDTSVQPVSYEYYSPMHSGDMDYNAGVFLNRYVEIYENSKAND